MWKDASAKRVVDVIFIGRSLALEIQRRRETV
jgi:hypothetical protein